MRKKFNLRTYLQHAAWMLLATLMLSACGSKKALVKPVSQPSATPAAKSETDAALLKLAFTQKVFDTKVYAENITGSMSFSLSAGSKNINLPGAVRMRKNKVIRLQLFIPLLGSEVGRLEFTPDYVLVVDRLHKEYIKTDYRGIDFLRYNGLNFYSLQALFWNQLLIPGKQSVEESDLKRFEVDFNAPGTQNSLSLKQGKFDFEWKADRLAGNISAVNVHYHSGENGDSELEWRYSNFQSVGVKRFPAEQTFSFTTNAFQKRQQATMKIEMNEVKTDSDWEEQTTLSGKYKKVEAQDVLSKIMP